MSVAAPTRRTIAKGAAWSVPVLAVASAAPSSAATPQLICAKTDLTAVPGGCNWNAQFTNSAGSTRQLSQTIAYTTNLAGSTGTFTYNFGYNLQGTGNVPSGTTITMQLVIVYPSTASVALNGSGGGPYGSYTRTTDLSAETVGVGGPLGFSGSAVVPSWSSRTYTATYSLISESTLPCCPICDAPAFSFTGMGSTAATSQAQVTATVVQSSGTCTPPNSPTGGVYRFTTNTTSTSAGTQTAAGSPYNAKYANYNSDGTTFQGALWGNGTAF